MSTKAQVRDVPLNQVFISDGHAFVKRDHANETNFPKCQMCNSKVVWNASNFNNPVHFCPTRPIELLSDKWHVEKIEN